MKKIIGLLLCLLFVCMCASALAGAKISSANFPDDIFREYVQQYDTDGNGTLSDAELKEVYSITVSGMQIADLKGIEFFIGLTNLYCDGNQLSALDVSKNTRLKTLFCGYNSITQLDISGNTELEYLSCTHNELTGLDVSGNKKLTELGCGQNLLTNLDVRKNTALTKLSCGENLLTALDIRKNTALTYVNCMSCQLTEVDISKNTLLESCSFAGNRFETFDASHNPALKYLDCGCTYTLNNLILGSVSSLEYLNCGASRLTGIDISKNTGLTKLICDRNPLLTSLDISHNPALVHLQCDGTALSSLDVSKCPALDKVVLENSMAYYEPWEVYGWWQPQGVSIDEFESSLLVDRGLKVITSDGTVYAVIRVSSIKLNKPKASMIRTSKVKKPTLQLTATVSPEDADNKSVEWTSSNPKVARVDENGLVTALKKGKVVITCKATDGSGVKASCTVTEKKS